MKPPNSVRTSAVPILAAAVVIASPLAVAADSGWYIGANAGEAAASIDDGDIIRGLLANGIATTAFSEDEHHLGFKLFGGYQFNKYFALEGGYFDLGKFKFRATTIPAGTLSGSIEVNGVNFDAVGLLPFNDKFSAFARAGANYAESEDSFRGTGSVIVQDGNRSERDINYKVGVGLQYALTDAFGLRLEAERYRIDDAVGNKGDIDLFSLGALYRFGSPPATTASTPPLPPPIVTATRTRVVVPVTAETQRYCSILDFQFEINQDDIQLEEKERLGVLGTFMKKYPETTAVIEGHTDNVGVAEENMKLSQRRADSVASWLQSNFQIAASRMLAVGYGETRPLADNSTEEGKRLNRRIGAIVACATDIEGLKVAAARITMAMVIEFDRNKADVKPEYHEELRRVAGFLKMSPSATATVEGHTGNLQATVQLAEEIAQRRAQNVVNYLVENFAIERSRLTAEGFGRTRQYAYNTSLEGQQENRRVNIIITYPKAKAK